MEKETKLDIKPIKKAAKETLGSGKSGQVVSGKSVPGWKPTPPVE